MIRLAALVLALLSLPAGAAGRPRVVVVKSADLTAYSAVVAGFSSEVLADVDELTLDGGATSAKAAFSKIAAVRPSLVLALGPAAATAARKLLSGVPVVFAMVPYYERYAVEGPNTTGIALTSNLSEELSTLKAVAAGIQRIGVLENPRYSGKLVEEISGVAAKLGLTIVPLELDSGANLEKVLRSARGRVEGLLMIGDKTVANAAVVRRLIAFAGEERLPMVALTPSQVKEGALLSLSPGFIGIGQQAGRLANRIIHEKVDPGALAVAQPEVLELAVSVSTARKLAKHGDLAVELLRLAARRGYVVKAYE